jgi:hypothetical protein
MPFTVIDVSGPMVSAEVAGQRSMFATNCSGPTEF